MNYNLLAIEPVGACKDWCVLPILLRKWEI